MPAQVVKKDPPSSTSSSPSTAIVDSNGSGSVLRPGSIGGLRTYGPEELQGWINMLLYGEPGIGKTHLIGSACQVPALCPVLILNIEDGAKTLTGAYGADENLTIVNPQTFGSVQKVFDELHRKKGAGFKTVVVDNATEGQKMGIEYIFDGDKTSTDFTEFEDATWANQGWNRSSQQIRKMIRYFRGLPMHTIFVSWRKDFSMPNDKVEKWGPAFSKSLASEVPGMFDSVFYYKWAAQNNKQVRVLQTQGTDRVVAKDRAGIGTPLPAAIVEPTMQQLCSLWGIA